MMSRQAIVRLDGQRVGVLTEVGAKSPSSTTPNGSPTQAVPVSLTLPLTEKPYASEGLHPFFENLLPEGWLLDLSTTAQDFQGRRTWTTHGDLCRLHRRR